jgi:hypothetical protein
VFILRPPFDKNSLACTTTIEGEGKYYKKNLLGDLFFADRLSVAAMVSKTTAEVVKEAMEVVPVKTVLAWCQEHPGTTLQAKKREAFNRQYRKEQKWAQLHDPG